MVKKAVLSIFNWAVTLFTKVFTAFQSTLTLLFNK